MTTIRRQGLFPGAQKKSKRWWGKQPADPKKERAKEVIKAFRAGLIPVSDDALSIRGLNVEFVRRDDSKRIVKQTLRIE